MMREPRRRSPGGNHAARRGRRARERSASSSSSSSSSASSSASLLDISRHYPRATRLGAVLSTFFRAPQNERDLRAVGRGRASGLSAVAAAAAAAAAGGDFLRTRSGSARGVSRRVADDESEWESASEESSDGLESGLAYGGEEEREKGTFQPSSVVDPRLFGPVNSLRGLVTPRPLDDEAQTTRYRDFNRLRSLDAAAGREVPMREVRAVPTADPAGSKGACSQGGF
ncbi:hypothetical protein CDD80_1496 [Ophiocordyceps camponoti-rufipedis]|uniref:Uncharacterized protein n=1 Tax=Ophiocordyceps camponoti-rufipedis TaxID=2004952 RepID=A0A2C5X8M6_9HYPO|nr:hypothetical protein CDD80_1496 [Ophiocordyceps camponoti-rufipedis]